MDGIVKQWDGENSYTFFSLNTAISHEVIK